MLRLAIFLFAYAEAWPESEEAAAVAVAEDRAARAAAGKTVIMDEDTWNRHEYLIATKARIPIIKGIALSFKLGILKIGRLLWPPTEFLAELQNAEASTSTDTFEPEVLVATSSSQGDAPNATTDQTRALLKAIPGRINVLLDSAGWMGCSDGSADSLELVSNGGAFSALRRQRRSHSHAAEVLC